MATIPTRATVNVVEQTMVNDCGTPAPAPQLVHRHKDVVGDFGFKLHTKTYTFFYRGNVKDMKPMPIPPTIFDAPGGVKPRFIVVRGVDMIEYSNSFDDPVMLDFVDANGKLFDYFEQSEFTTQGVNAMVILGPKGRSLVQESLVNVENPLGSLTQEWLMAVAKHDIYNIDKMDGDGVGEDPRDKNALLVQDYHPVIIALCKSNEQYAKELQNRRMQGMLVDGMQKIRKEVYKEGVASAIKWLHESGLMSPEELYILPKTTTDGQGQIFAKFRIEYYDPL
jgi:hypothetical protein